MQTKTLTFLNNLASCNALLMQTRQDCYGKILLDVILSNTQDSHLIEENEIDALKNTVKKIDIPEVKFPKEIFKAFFLGKNAVDVVAIN